MPHAQVSLQALLVQPFLVYVAEEAYVANLSGAALLWPLVLGWCIALSYLEDFRLALNLMASVLLRVLIFRMIPGYSTYLIFLVKVTDKLYQQNASLIKEVGSVVHIVWSTSRRPAVARDAVYSVGDSGMTYYGSTQPGDEWCIAACDAL